LEIASFLSKAHDWKSPEVIKQKIIGLKRSQLAKGIKRKKN
jgi:hypothetical protein